MLGGFGIVVVVLFIVLSARQFGSSYTDSLSTILPILPDAPKTRERRVIRRVTVKHDDGGCLEITPDGVVRSFDTCGGELTDVNRLADPKHILELVDMMSSIDISKFQRPGPNTLTLVIETDKGSVTIYVPITHGSTGGYEDHTISDTIDLITGDIPQPTSTPMVSLDSPTPTLLGVQPILTSTPTPTLPFWITPTPTTASIQPFTCDFSETSPGKKPYYVSGVLCTSLPIAPP